MKLKSHGVRFDVSVVITSYNSKDLLDKCIFSIIEQTKKHPYQIIVVDDASSDGSVEHIRSKYKDKINIIINPINLGYVRSNNIGMRNSDSRYVLSLNNDTSILDGAIDKLIDLMDNRPDIGAGGPKLLNSDGSIQPQCRRSFPTPLNALYYFIGISKIFPKSRKFGAYLLSYLDDGKEAEVDSLCGAAMMVRRQVIEKVGLMSEDYRMYGDDIDWCWRIKEAGWKVYYFPQVRIVHYGGRGGSSRQSFRNIYEFHRSMAVFYRQHYAKAHFFVINRIIYSAIWTKYIFASLLNLFRKDKFVGTKKP